MTYEDLLAGKIKVAHGKGIECDVSKFHPSTKPHQRDIIEWNINMSATLVAADGGLGKSHMAIETLRYLNENHKSGKYLIVTELGATETFINPDPEVGEGARLGVKLEYVTCDKEAFDSECAIIVTNYERVRMGEFDFSLYVGVWLDEGNYIKNMASETTDALQKQLRKVQWKYIATATPSPNETLEIINYAHALGICDRGQILTRFFQRNSVVAGDLTLHPHHEDDFWLWVYSWATFITRPSDLGYPDEGYELPPLNVYWHEVSINKKIDVKPERDGQGKMFLDSASSLPDAAKIKRESIEARLIKCLKIIDNIFEYDEQRILSIESGSGEGTELELLLSKQAQDRQGEAKGLHEDVSENLSTEKSNTGADSGEKQEKEGTIQLGSDLSGNGSQEIERITKTESFDEAQHQVEGGIRNNAGSVQSNSSESEQSMRDLRDIDDNKGKVSPIRRSRSRNRKGSGNTLPELQFWIGSLQRRSEAFKKCNRLPQQIIIWCNLNDEQRAIEAALKKAGISYSSIYGDLKMEEKSARLLSWLKKETTVFISKPEMSGCGLNLQQSCIEIFFGITHSFDDFYQALKRVYRFGLKTAAHINGIYASQEYEIVNNLKEKWELHDIQRAKMRDIVLKYGLGHSKHVAEKRRSFKTDRRIWEGKDYQLINNDSVYETQKIFTGSVHMILSSFPFGNHYEYTDKYNDFGHNESNEGFFDQMDYLIPEMFRALAPGRIAAIHLKNRIRYGSVTGLGFSIVERFTHKVCAAMEKHGFYTLGWHYIPTDVVAENAQTYRLGWTEMCKDSTKMGAGIPEEIWVFRKPPTSNSDAYADEKVIHDKAFYTRARWQIDADAFWQTDGDRLLTPLELKGWGLDRIMRWWKKYNSEKIYNNEKHVELLEALDAIKKLSSSFTTLPLQSVTGYIWNEVNRMHGLNMEQSKRKQQNHICPMPFDEVNRLIELYTNPGELVYDPFGGIGTTGVCAIRKKRKVLLCELNETYAKCAAAYLKEAEMKRNIPTLFDALKTA